MEVVSEAVECNAAKWRGSDVVGEEGRADAWWEEG